MRTMLVAAVIAATCQAAFAQDTGVAIPPSPRLLFGKPKGGAPLIREASSLALDLPNRALVYQDAQGRVWVSYNDIASLFARHRLKRTPDPIKAIEARQAPLFDRATE